MNKCDWCEHSYLANDGQLQCKFFSCHMTAEELEKLINLIFGGKQI